MTGKLQRVVVKNRLFSIPDKSILSKSSISDKPGIYTLYVGNDRYDRSLKYREYFSTIKILSKKFKASLFVKTSEKQVGIVFVFLCEANKNSGICYITMNPVSVNIIVFT